MPGRERRADRAGARHAGRSLSAAMPRHAADICGPKARLALGGSCPPSPLRRVVCVPWPGMLSTAPLGAHARGLLGVRHLSMRRGRGCESRHVLRRWVVPRSCPRVASCPPPALPQIRGPSPPFPRLCSCITVTYSYGRVLYMNASASLCASTVLRG